MLHPMNCKGTRKLLDAYLDEELSQRQAAAVREHLLKCPECRAEWLLEKQLRDDISAVAPEIPADLHERIMAAVADEKTVARCALEESAVCPVPQKKAKKALFTAAVAAACVCLCTIAVLTVTFSANRKGESSDSVFGSAAEKTSANDSLNRHAPEAGTCEVITSLLPESAEKPSKTQECTTDSERSEVSSLPSELLPLSLVHGEKKYTLSVLRDFPNSVSLSDGKIAYFGTAHAKDGILTVRLTGDGGNVYESLWDASGTFLSGDLPWEETP